MDCVLLRYAVDGERIRSHEFLDDFQRGRFVNDQPTGILCKRACKNYFPFMAEYTKVFAMKGSVFRDLRIRGVVFKRNGKSHFAVSLSGGC